jgi:putative redox protein
MYAERKGIALTHVSVSLSHAKIDVDGVARDHIERSITLLGTLTDEQRQRLLEIANKCPVHRALSSSFVIASTLASSGITPQAQ